MSDKQNINTQPDKSSNEILQERKRRIFSIRTLLFTVFAVIIVYFLLKNVDPLHILNAFKKANPVLIICAVLLYAVSNFAKAVRFKIVLSDFNISMSKLYIITSFHNFFNFILPARTGELTLVYYLNTIAGVKGSRGVHSLLVARILDLAVVGIFFISSLILYSWDILPVKLAIGGAVLVAGAIAALFFMRQIICLCTGLFISAMNYFKLSEKKIFAKAVKTLNSVQTEFENTHIKDIFLRLIFISFIVWGILYALYYCIMSAFIPAIPFLQVVAGSTGAVLTNVLPVNAAGAVGTYEAGWVGGFMLTGLDKDNSVITAFASHTVFFGASLIMACISYIFKLLFLKE